MLRVAAALLAALPFASDEFPKYAMTSCATRCSCPEARHGTQARPVLSLMLIAPEREIVISSDLPSLSLTLDSRPGFFVAADPGTRPARRQGGGELLWRD